MVVVVRHWLVYSACQSRLVVAAYSSCSRLFRLSALPAVTAHVNECHHEVPRVAPMVTILALSHGPNIFSRGSLGYGSFVVAMQMVFAQMRSGYLRLFYRCSDVMVVVAFSAAAASS